MVGGSLLVIGLLLSVAGIVLGSSRDLTALVHLVLAKAHMLFGTVASRVGVWWRRLRRRPNGTSVSVPLAGGVAGASGGSAYLDVWNPVPDDDLDTAIARLRERDETLRSMIARASSRQREEISRLEREHASLSAALRREVGRLEGRIDDFDVKPAGQRALGALLVVCGTMLMALGGLLQQLA